MNCEPAKHSVASVVLNYNSDTDVMTLVPQLLAQEGVDHNIIIVDNASRQECVQRLVDWLLAYPGVVIGTPEEVAQRINDTPAYEHRLYFVLNRENRGYSAGNNIGIRLAERLRSKAVLIANPDMRIEDRNFISVLARYLFSDDQVCIAASKILDPKGINQNPLREATFLEELFWPRWVFPKLFQNNSYTIPYNGSKIISVPKVSGCCMLLKMKFLSNTCYLDEKVFLYCEEPILAAKVNAVAGRILFVPEVSATHAHKSSEKGNRLMRMVTFVKSRKYYLISYSGYSKIKVKILLVSYFFLLQVFFIGEVVMLLKRSFYYLLSNKNFKYGK